MPAPVSIRSCGFAVVNVLGDAADAVAAHFAFAAICVEHPHLRVSYRAGKDQDHAVAANAEPSVRDLNR